MKKFIIFMLFLLIIGTAGFYMGWAQFVVPPGSYGVMRSKTHGVDLQVIKEGEFRWVWYKLIPGNAEIRIYTPGYISQAIWINGSLNSGNVYAAVAGNNADFSWEFYCDISFSISPEALPLLSITENLNSQEDLEALENEYAQRIETFIQRRLYTIVTDEDVVESLLLTGILPEINREIEAVFPELEKIRCNFRVIKYPDILLYRSLRELYAQYLAFQMQLLEDEVSISAEFMIGSRLRFDELEKYGEILSRYPILLEFLALESDLSLNLFYRE